ncbi:PDZ domain-containing protein [Phycisphaera mikurensis]|uniref:PDZ domain-containing protein n=1 Tax=Phycisphaera mikurensis TaxID=547188 RepID=UPI00059DF5DA|nr:PDZ domain-containing protein [Phycisphaera mikurensis]MBB6440893.1 hypothetical protein [Phycisphaera mikurensis]
MTPTLQELDADAGPVAGVDVLAVAPDGAARAAGVRAGEVIVAINGESVLRYPQLTPLRGREGGDRIAFADAEGRTREHAFGDGLIGVSLRTRPARLALAVSRAMARDEAWNGALLDAAWALERRDPGEAARRLEAVRAAGCPDDPVFRGLAFRVAAGLGELDRAGELLATLPERTDHQNQLHLPGPLDRYRFFLASGRTGDLVDLVERRPGFFPFARLPRWPAQAAFLRSGGPASPPGAAAPPAAAEPAGPARVVNPMLHGAAEWPWGADFHTHDDLIVENRPLLISQRPAFYKQAFLTRNEPFGDFDLHASFTVRLTGPPSERWPSSMLINVSDYETTPEPDGPAYFGGETSVLGANFQAFSDGEREVTLLHGWGHYEPIAASFFDGTAEHHLHLSRRGGRRTVVLDGRTLLDLPANPTPRRLVFHLHVVGLEADFRAFEIIEPRPAR